MAARLVAVAAHVAAAILAGRYGMAADRGGRYKRTAWPQEQERTAMTFEELIGMTIEELITLINDFLAFWIQRLLDFISG